MAQLVLAGIGDYAANARLDKDPDLAVGPDEVLVRMEAAPINPVDTLFANGWYPIQPTLPQRLGSEGVGRVTAAGAAVQRELVGRRVVLRSPYGGTWGHEIVVRAADVVVAPEGVDAKQLAMLVINPATAYLMLKRHADLKPGDWVGQNLGNSAVAASVVALNKAAGVKTLSVVRSAAAAAAARELGADAVLIEGDDLTAQIAEVLGDKRLRLVLDGAATETVGVLAGALENGGAVLSYSSVTGTAPVLPLGDVVFRNVSHHGVWVGAWLLSASAEEVEQVLGELAELVRSGAIAVPVDSTFPLDQFADAFARNASPERVGKVLFTFD
ncbi:zinc-dependent alcohol dehydrogenase family protein [Kutzneria chonburiensis]|uniref:enoyl-[acyl-carrier-protein] reductase n=1 Tax=Kutzneria chonburiensis TaxID=1483604 RepID=A0ABV6N5N5_9PSEU|nr:zinc-dependent alcohol dehydrogenase family protein [Kutzneria chonburiensis]